MIGTFLAVPSMKRIERISITKTNGERGKKVALEMRGGYDSKKLLHGQGGGK